MLQYTYLLIDLLAVSIPFIFSFHPRINFYKRWPALFPGILITALIFIFWDILFTHLGVWSFNDDYVTGIKIFNLPVEEILFFICIPYSCVFTYYCISIYRIEKRKWPANFSGSLILLLISTGIYYFDRMYTSVTFISCALFLFYIVFISRRRWLNNFYISCLLLIIPFFICNGILTGTGLEDAVVKYNNSENMGIRILTIPIEDTFYGMLMILINITLFEFFTNRQGQLKA